jgi:hypothetical protein
MKKLDNLMQRLEFKNQMTKEEEEKKSSNASINTQTSGHSTPINQPNI